jgi:hypothetical protein
MRLRQPTAWQRVLALAPLLLVLVSVPAQVLLRCRMDGRVRDACCCPSDSDKAATAPALSRPCCCHREVSKHSPSVASTTEASPAVASLLGSLTTQLLPEPHSASRVPGRGRPAREGPPLLLLKQAFLI